MLLLLVGSAPSAAGAEVPFWPLPSRADGLVAEAVAARERAEYRLATALLDEAEAEVQPPRGRILHERGLLAQARGQLEEAVGFFARAAEIDITSSSRIEQAGVLVQLGRWPEAVAVLRRAFEERGNSLRVDAVAGDARFVRLAAFEPYRTLIDYERLQQASAFARLTVTLERIDRTTRATREVAERTAAVLTFFWRFGAAVAAPVVLLVLLGLLCTFGVSQLRLLDPPWTLVVGMLVAAALWHVGARVVRDDPWGDAPTIGWALAVVFVPWVVALAARWVWRRRRRLAPGGADPLAREQVPHTLALVEEAARVGRVWREQSGAERDAAWRDLRLALEALHTRFNRRSERRLPPGGKEEKR